LIDSRAAAEFRRDALGAEFAALGEETEIIGIVRAIRQQRVGKLEDPLEIEVPGGEPQFPVEHRHPVAHIVECNAPTRPWRWLISLSSRALSIAITACAAKF